MKRALVLGASALLILALNQNAIREVSACHPLLHTESWDGLEEPVAVPAARVTLAFLPAAVGCIPGSLKACDRHPDFGKCYQAPWSTVAVRLAVLGIQGRGQGAIVLFHLLL